MDQTTAKPEAASQVSDAKVDAAVKAGMAAAPGASKTEVEQVIKPLPDKVVLQIANVGLLDDGFGFLGCDEGHRIYHVLKKHTQTRPIYDALEFFRAACDADLQKQADVAQPSAATTPVNAAAAGNLGISQDALAAGMKMADKPVRLKKVMKWKDLAHMRHARSVYLGRRYGDVFMTKVLQAETIEEAVPQLAGKVLLTDKALRIIDGAGRERSFALDHPMSVAVSKVAQAMRDRGIDAADIDAAAATKLCWVGETPGDSFVPEDLKGARAKANVAAPQPNSAAPSGPDSTTAPAAKPASAGPAVDLDQINLEAAEMPGPDEETLGPIAAEVATPPPAPVKPELIDAAALDEWHIPVSTTPREHLVFAAMRLNDEQIARIHEALKILAAADDGATKRDNVGFSAEDSDVGNELAKGEKLSPMQASLGRMFVLYYSRQLSATMPGFKAELRHGVRDQKVLRKVAVEAPVAPRDNGTASAPAATAPTPQPGNAGTPPAAGVVTLTRKGDKIRIDGKLKNVPSTHLDAIKAFLAQVGIGNVRVVEQHMSKDRFTWIDKLMVGTAQVTMADEVAVATSEAGVPPLPTTAPTPAAVAQVEMTLTAMTEPRPVVAPAVTPAPTVPASEAPSSQQHDDVALAAGPAPSLEDGTPIPSIPNSAAEKLRPRKPSTPDI